MFTRDQWERWDSETRVMVDLFLERGAVAEVPAEEVERRFTNSHNEVKPYHLTSVFAPIDIASYALWNGTSEISSGGVFTAEILEAYARLMKHPDCPLWKCEEFNGQTEVPRAGHRPPPPPFRLVVPGQPATPEVREWLRDVEQAIWDEIGDPVFDQLIEQYAGAIGIPPELLEVPDYRHVVRIANIETDREGKLAPKPDPSPKSKVPRFLRERNQRLDGRR